LKSGTGSDSSTLDVADGTSGNVNNKIKDICRVAKIGKEIRSTAAHAVLVKLAPPLLR